MRSIGRRYIILFILLCSALVLSISTGAFAETEQSESAEQPPVRIAITADGREFIYSDEKITPSDFSVAEQIELRKINAPLAEKLSLVDMWLAKGADYKTALGVCFPRLNGVVRDVAEHLFMQPVDAEVEYSNGKFNVTREKTGRALDENMLYANIYCCLKYNGGGTIKATTTELLPCYTQKELRENLKLRSSYTTDYATSTAARSHNVSLALSKFDGVKILPGETLSFNKTVGARTEDNGFKSAKIIVDGKYTDGVGGGVCQASTAVYNAALVAGLNASANAHSICPSYCPPGLDAMISSVSDLVITNTTAHAIYITVKTGGGKGTVKIYGEASEYSIVPEGVTVSTAQHENIEIVDNEHKYLDATADTGDRMLVSPGRDGVSSETYLNYYKHGKLIKRAKIRENVYKSTPQVIAVAP